MISNIKKVLKLIILRSPKNFILMCFLLGIELATIALSVFSLIPLADYILDPSLNNPSKFSKHILEFYKNYNIEITFFNLGIIFIFGQLMRGIVTSLINFSILKIKYEFIKKINIDVLNTILSSKWNFFSKSNYGKIINTFSKEIDNVGTTIGHIARSFASFFQLIFFISIPIYLNFKVALIIIILFLLLAFLVIKIGNPLSFKFGKLNVKTANQLVSNFVETLQAAKLIKINSKEKIFTDKHVSKFDNHVKATLRSQMLQQIFNAFYQPIGIIIIISVFGFFINSEILLSEIAAIFYSLISIVSLSNTLVGVQINISNFLPSYEQVEGIIIQAKKFQEKFGKNKFNSLNKDIQFENVSFGYNQDKNVINNVSIQVKKNNITAIIGESGSGKSTLADLLVGIIIPNEGKIKINGVNLLDFEISSYRENIGYVSQEVFLFNDSIRNNLSWVLDDKIDDNKIWDALKLANADKFVSELPEKLNTNIGERGVQLSGGQRQRLSLARIFLKKPKILILDEATSSLDSLTEIEIQNSIHKLSSDQEITFLIIAHRLSTIKNASQIIVLESGKIVQKGTYNELVALKDGKFNIMLNSQIIK